VSRLHASPLRVDVGGCGYDSLNIGVNSFPNAPFSGTDTNADQFFVNHQSDLAGALESGWTGYRPLGAISTTK
jgi:hypothetical protein